MAKTNSKKRSSTSLQAKQLSSFFVSFLLPSFLLIILLFCFFINQTMNFYEKEHKNTLEILSSHLTNTINSDLEMSLAYIFDDDIYYFYNFLSRTDTREDLIAFNQYLQSYSKAISRYMTLLNPNILGVGFLPLNKNADTYIYCPKYSRPEILGAPDYSNTDWYSALRQNNSNVIFTNTSDDVSDHTLALIRVAKNVDMNKELGYVIVDVSMDFLYNLLDDLVISKHSGIVLLSPKNEFLFSTNDTLSDVAAQLTSMPETLSYHNDTYRVYSFKEASSGFTFFYLSSNRDLYASFAGAFLLVLGFYVLMVVLAFFMFHYNSKEIAHSVSPILLTMTRYQGGDSHIHCDSRDCKITEFMSISDNLNDMIDKVNTHIANEYKLQIEQKTAEYQALQAEIDPHFLYNTLNLFITLNRLGQKQELEKAVINLSHLFRYTCEHTSDSTIAKEFTFITDYLSLQKIRFDDRLTFEVYIDQNLESFRIPKLLIQPLVENAVVHALEPSDQAVHIQLSAIKVENINHYNFTIITVINTGLPFIEKNVVRKRIGLKNIEERLAIFNPNAFFIISGGTDKPTKCYIIIPTPD